MGTENYFKGNNYKLFETYGIGYDLRNREFYFSIEDYDMIKKYTWNVNPSHGYVICSSKNIRMHRLIMGEPSCKVDHINLKRNDNRRENLRLISNRGNVINRGLIKTNTSGVTGVYYYKNLKKWEACIWLDYQSIRLGLFINKEDAIKARLKAEQQYYGEFSRIESQEISNNFEIKNEKCMLTETGGNPSGHVGINWNKNSEKWYVFDKAKYICSFDNLEDAIAFKDEYDKKKRFSI